MTQQEIRVSRRRILRAAVAGSAALVADWAAGGQETPPGAPHIACNQYPWFMFFGRENRDFNAALDASVAEVARSGVEGFEPLIGSAAYVDTLVPSLNQRATQSNASGRGRRG